MKDIIARRMQAEADANDDKTAKSISQSQTSAYQLLYSDTPTTTTATNQTSGKALRESLLRRAKAKQMGIDKTLGYTSSKMGRNDYRDTAFTQSDNEEKSSILGTVAAKKKQKDKKIDRSTDKDIQGRDKRQRFNATKETDNTTKSSDTTNRQGYNSRRGSFNEPPARNYNPYA